MIYIVTLFLAIGAVVLTAMLLLLGSVALEKWRDRQAMRVRDDQLRKYCITPELPTRRIK